MKEGTPILKHLNTFNKIISDFLRIDVKVKEDQSLIFLNSVPSYYDYLVTMILYRKETFVM